ncbi:transcriptional regulator domain-containing protein [Bradyrhizobium sp. CCBAU 51745]|uniref:transcriptional regulator domain-containing protein n=1 Tax=Bradyrhizobium sp. CCBAU 51745 TaxID=1325099 RepID=UPI003FA4B035
MRGPDWRSEEAYSDFKKAEAADVAWEWLRRDPDCQVDYRRLSRRQQSSADTEQLRGKWGCCGVRAIVSISYHAPMRKSSVYAIANVYRLYVSAFTYEARDPTLPLLSEF